MKQLFYQESDILWKIDNSVYSSSMVSVGIAIVEVHDPVDSHQLAIKQLSQQTTPIRALDAVR